MCDNYKGCIMHKESVATARHNYIARIQRNDFIDTPI